jgi:carbon-monoxide dehydrogenase medium subunit
VRRFELATPRTLDECLAVLAARGHDAKPVAGGTDLLPQLKNGLLRPALVVDLSGVAPLRALYADPAALHVGAAVTAREIERHPDVVSRYAALAESGALLGSVQVRNLATIGGNVCNAAPSADMAAPLLALDALAVIAGPAGQRRVPLASFFTGVRRTVLGPAELLVEFVVPAPAPRSGGSYLRHTPRRELDIAVVGVASQLTLSDGACSRARIALVAVAPTPIRATAAEQALEGHPVTTARIERAAELAVAAAQPITDQRASAEFRRHLVGVLTRRTLATALSRADH